ncbi:MAG: hypothetical protein J3K34DRAFT_440271 [Monoraphidium minutum]|nr:MAG: hypothetical protein J3K34DRAFT_440271 [Monoraphidium minutum]
MWLWRRRCMSLFRSLQLVSLPMDALPAGICRLMPRQSRAHGPAGAQLWGGPPLAASGGAADGVPAATDQHGTPV